MNDLTYDTEHEKLIDKLYEENLPISSNNSVNSNNSITEQKSDSLKKIDIDSITKKDFIRACREGKIDVVDCVLTNKKFETYNSGFITAAKNGHENVVNLFIKNGITNWNRAFPKVAARGQIFMLNKCIEHGANNFNEALRHTINSYDEFLPENIYKVIVILVTNGANCFSYVEKKIKKTLLKNDKFLIKYFEQQKSKMTNALINTYIDKN